MPVLVVQMGHSGRTSGATGAPGEMAFTEAVGAACYALDGVGGWSVRTIAADPAPSAYRGDAFVAIHADGSSNPAVRGACIGYQTSDGRTFGSIWASSYVQRGWSGPWNPDNYTANLAQYYGVRTAVAEGNRRAFIAECGTITNPDERAAMTSSAGVDRVVAALGDALGITQPAPPAEEEDMNLISFELGPTSEGPSECSVVLPGPAQDSAPGRVGATRVYLFGGFAADLAGTVWFLGAGHKHYLGSGGAVGAPLVVKADEPAWFPVPDGTEGIAFRWTNPTPTAVSGLVDFVRLP